MQKSDSLFLLVLATIPIQLNKFFFLDYSFVLGLPIDYRALTIYASDIAILLYLATFVRENYKKINKIISKFKPFATVLLIFNFYLFASTIFSISKEASLIFNLRVLIYSVLSLAAAHTISKKAVASYASRVLTFSLIWQSLLIVSQFVLQKSLGLWILGERTFNALTPAIAHTTLLGQQLLRPYGTFPHPNVAGAFLAIGLILTRSKLLNLLITIPALTLTFARTAITTLAITAFLSLSKTRKLLAGIIAIIAAILFGPAILSSIPTASIAERILLIQAALDIALLQPIIGIGSNNFILELAKLDLVSLAETRLLQPVHNVFLLILVENGIVGLLLFATLMMVVAQNVKGNIKTALFLAILIYASFDHFLWTLHQGQLMFWLTTAYIIGTKESVKRGV